ncbi:MAG TPA: LLM class F420-dependent oxidoreductase [Solirubrobacterales bacterium]|nr:LLM class F420-dependent oxidoreductase [Solirubrobacterales bacterium]
MRLGLAVPIEALGLAETLAVARDAETLGYDDLWTSEVGTVDGFAPLAALAEATTTTRLGLSLAPVFTRPAALLAMSAATLQTIAEGRFVLGLGSSSPAIVERWMGGTYERPLTRVRETVEAVRAMLSGEKVTIEGETIRSHDFRLGLGPTWVPIYIGALGPKMSRLAGEIADGILLSFATAEGAPILLDDFRAGARAAGRDPADLGVQCRVTVSADPDGPELQTMLRRFIVGYGTVPAYNAHLARQGFPAEAAAMAAAWAEGRRADALEAVSENLLRSLIPSGSPAECLERLGAYAAAGIDTVTIEPVSAAPDPAERRTRVRRLIEAIGALHAG